MPEIFNWEQGSQFTGFDFTEQLKKNEIRISRDGRGRAMGNIITERLWRSVKDEEVYLRDYQSVWEAQEGVGGMIAWPPGAKETGFVCG